MAKTNRLQTLDLIVTMTDGTVHEVTVGNPDMLRYENEAARRKWPRVAGESPITWQTFCAWAALTRHKQLDGMPYETFAAGAEQFKHKNPPRKARPTRPAREAG